jgi:hypothetical protein
MLHYKFWAVVPQPGDAKELLPSRSYVSQKEGNNGEISHQFIHFQHFLFFCFIVTFPWFGVLPPVYQVSPNVDKISSHMHEHHKGLSKFFLTSDVIIPFGKIK